MRSLSQQLLLLALAIAAIVQNTLPASSQLFPRYTQTEGQLDSYGLPISGARLCVLGKPDICFQMPSHILEGSGKVIYEFGLDPHSERLSLPKGESWIFFTATFSGGGSGTLERLAVLHYDNGKIVNLLPYVAVTNLSQRVMWSVPSVSPYPVLVDADFIWDKGETHFDPHFYTVEAWRYDPSAGQYV